MKSLYPKRVRHTKPDNALETSANTESKLRLESPTSASGQIVSVAIVLASAILLALLIKAFLFQPYIVDGQSMETTLQDNDRLIVNKIPRTIARIDSHAYIPQRGDIIIFNQSGLPGYTGEKQLIKRVIGLPGDHVVIKDGAITIYNASDPHGFNPDTSLHYRISSPITIGDIDLTLGQNQIFVCGDNRNNSEDSRYFGPVNVNNVVGKLALRILPLGQAERF